MSDEKKYTAKDVALAVLAKAQEVYKSSELSKGEISSLTNTKSKLKGVHQSPDWQPEKGKSYAGTSVRSSVGNGRHGLIGQGEIAEAKETHQEVLKEIKAAPKPNLGKDETFNQKKVSEAGMQSQMKAEGVDQTPPDGVKPDDQNAVPRNGDPAAGAEPKNQGSNYVGSVSKGHIKLAKFVGAMAEKRKKAAPAAPAAAPAMGKAEGGINMPAKQLSSHTHDSEKRGNGSNLAGVSEAGAAVRASKLGTSSPGHGKAVHKEVLSEIKAAPKPKLPG